MLRCGKGDGAEWVIHGRLEGTVFRSAMRDRIRGKVLHEVDRLGREVRGIDREERQSRELPEFEGCMSCPGSICILQ